MRGNVVSLTGDENFLSTRALGGNSCDDGACSPTGNRSFYLTQSIHEGNTPGSACDAGFRVAQISDLRWAVRFDPAPTP